MAPLPNATVVAGYRIDGALGEGGMGTVYRATQLSLERVVALKLLISDLSADPAFQERFRREGQLQAALDHPHIVTVYEAGQTEYGLFLAMRVVEGPTLKKLIQSGQLGDRRALRLLTQVADALDAAHEKGLIHRDVKPQNVLVGANDHAYLTDFGLTRASGDEGMTETGHFVGTIDYISPEQARGERALPQSDVYALTAVLYESLTGLVPFRKTSEDRVLLAHLTEEPPKPSEVRSNLPPALDAVIARGMAKDPDERPASASELMLEARRAFGAAPPPRPPRGTPDATRIGTVEGDAATTRMADAQDSGVTRMVSSAAVAPATAAALTAPAGAGTAGPAGGSAGARAGTPAGATRAAPAADAGSGHRTLRLVAIVLVVGVVAAAAGLLLGKSPDKHVQAPPHAAHVIRYGNSASAGSLGLSFPASWQQLSTPPAVPGLDFVEPLALALSGAAGDSGQMLVAGDVTDVAPSLLPGALVGKLSAPLPKPATVRLGSADAYVYSGLMVKGVSEPVTLYVVPTSSGVATIACLGKQTAVDASAPATSSVGDCARIAATLRLSGASVYGLGPSPKYAASLAHSLATLHASVASAAVALDKAKTAKTQAAAADRLAGAYRKAAASLSTLTVSPAVQSLNAAVAAPLHQVAVDYTNAARAARSLDTGSYTSASRAAGKDVVLASKALAALHQAGYSVAG